MRPPRSPSGNAIQVLTNLDAQLYHRNRPLLTYACRGRRSGPAVDRTYRLCVGSSTPTRFGYLYTNVRDSGTICGYLLYSTC
jgi:hypothetical protein